MAVALAAGLWLSASPGASAADGSAPPRPQVLWHAYPLSSPQDGTGKARPVNTGAPHTRPASAPSNDPHAAPPAARTFPTVPLAAAAALAAAIIAVIVLVRRRRGAARPGDAVAPPAAAPTGRRGLLQALSQEDGALAPARRGIQPGAAKAGERSSGAAAGGRVTKSLLESLRPVPQARVVQAERVERRVTPNDGRDRPSVKEKEVLRRKSETADARAAAKLKSRTQSSAALKHATERDLSRLKAKLGEARTEPGRTSAQLKRTRSSNGTPAPMDHAPAPSTPDKGKLRTSARAPATPSRCRIDWRADGDDSRFCAIGRTPTGAESVLHCSPTFEWKDDGSPSQDLPQAGSAYRALVSRLVAEGWMATGIREHWYELELERAPEHARATKRQEGRT